MMIRQRFLFLSILLVGLFVQKRAMAQDVSLTVTNPTDIQRQEVVEADLQAICELLGTDSCEALKVKNALGQEMTWQKSHDGRLLLCVSLQPNGKVVYTISKGEPSTFKSSVFGRIYPERADDLTWENDRGIYRMYGPALQRSGEKSYGTDVWTKNTPELVAEDRYHQHIHGWQQGNTLNTSFHLDHGYGMDVYAVGASLGCGAPALMQDGQLRFPYCFKDCQILDNGPLRFTAELTYDTTADGTTEHRLVTLDKGSHYNKMTVWYDGIGQPTSLAMGVVLHSDDGLILGKDYALYADPTDNPAVHQSQIYVGVLFPDDVSETIRLEGKPSHAVGIVRPYTGARYTYYFGSAWSNYDVRTMAHWQLLAEEYLTQSRQPLSVQLSISK